MPINILMPALSPTMEKGNLARWLKKEGDAVKAGDVIAEIETDKATMEYESIDDGVLAKIVVPEGTQDVPVNQLIAVLAGEGEDASKVTAASGATPPAKAEAPKAAAPYPAPAAPPSPSGGGISAPAARPDPSPRSGEGGRLRSNRPGGGLALTRSASRQIASWSRSSASPRRRCSGNCCSG